MPKKETGVYETFTQNLNPIRVKNCSHACVYCYMNPIKQNAKEGVFKTGFYPTTLIKKSKMKNRSFFLCTSCDIFDPQVPDEWIIETINIIKREFNRSNTFCMLTKNPKRYMDFLDIIPHSWLLGCTIETDAEELISRYSKATSTRNRIDWMKWVKQKHPNIFVMLEPLMLFTSRFTKTIRSIKPNYVVIGANSRKDLVLPEPTTKSLKKLINDLRKADYIVIVKSNIERLGVKSVVGYLNKDNTKFRWKQTQRSLF